MYQSGKAIQNDHNMHQNLHQVYHPNDHNVYVQYLVAIKCTK
jgi:hypothetical protein